MTKYYKFDIILKQQVFSYDQIQMKITYKGKCGTIQPLLVYKLYPQTRQDDILDKKIVPNHDLKYMYLDFELPTDYLVAELEM